MLKKLFKVTFVVGLIAALSACGSTPQSTVALQSNKLASPDIKVGYVYYLPQKSATTHIYGAACLLCYGVAATLTATLDTHIESTFGTDELENIQKLVMSEYQEKAARVEYVTLPTPINKLKKFKGELGFAKKDFRPLKSELDVDVVVVLNIWAHGAHRTFANYIPTSDPKGFIGGLLYAVDTTTNEYLQYLELTEIVQPEGEWDEPKDFPSVTTSYYQAAENVKEKIRSAL